MSWNYLKKNGCYVYLRKCPKFCNCFTVGRKVTDVVKRQSFPANWYQQFPNTRPFLYWDTAAPHRGRMTQKQYCIFCRLSEQTREALIGNLKTCKKSEWKLTFMSWILNKFRRIAKFRLDFSGSCQKTGTIEIFLQKIQKQRLIT